MQIVADPATIDARAWDALVDADGGNPFVTHAFLSALSATGCATVRTGWQPQFLLLQRAGVLVGAVPLYAKAHSFGEYVFDWSWADACARHGIAYYPKLLAAVPFTPVGGPRLLAADATARTALADALLAHARASGMSSLHVLFPPAADLDLLQARGCAVRHGVQFHWRNRGFADFDDFLAALAQPKRKKIRAERRKVHDAGVRLERRSGARIAAEDWALLHRCYLATYAAHGSTPYLNLRFFTALGAALADRCVLVIARRDDRPIAASLGVFDRQRLYGRHWGALEAVDCLHFECCYYQMIEFAIERGLAVFEGGAQGAHKMARGLDPVPTRSAHWIADPALRAAVARFVTHEAAEVDHALDELGEHAAWRNRAPPGG